MHWYVCRELEVRETTPPVSLPRDFPFLVWLLDSWVTSGATYHRSRDRSLQKAHNHSSVTMVKIIYPTKKSQYAGWRFDNLQLRYYQLVSWIKQASYSWDDLTQQKCNTGLSMKWPKNCPQPTSPIPSTKRKRQVTSVVYNLYYPKCEYASGDNPCFPGSETEEDFPYLGRWNSEILLTIPGNNKRWCWKEAQAHFPS